MAGDVYQELGIKAPTSTPEIRREGETFIFEFPSLGITCELSRLGVEKGGAHGILFVKTTNPGFDPIVSFDKNLLLTPTGGFTTPARYLASRMDLKELYGVSWESVLERIAGEAVIALRQSANTVILGMIERRTAPLYAVAPLALYNERTILYGDGGTGKSTLALAIAIAYRTGREVAGLIPTEQGSVLYLDWEQDAQTVDWRLRCLLKGMNYDGEFPHMGYKQCFQPLVEIADSLGREIHEMNIGMVIIDSVTWAVAGSAKDEDMVLPMFNAMRRWGCHVLCIDHVRGDAGQGAERPYGSVFKRNAARLLWNVRQAETKDSDLHIGLYSAKGNFTGSQKPIGFRMGYFAGGLPTTDSEMADEIVIVAEDVREQATPTRGSTHDRILAAIRLAPEALTSGEIEALVNAFDKGKRVSQKTILNNLDLMVKSKELAQVVTAGEARKWRTA